MTDQREILVGERDDGTDLHLPVVELLTGRGFVTGKSGSGKSNTASVIAEELLESGFPLLIVDTDGEYYGLKEEYEMLHAGADEECDIQIGPEHAEQMASLALEENVPVILDVSGYLDEEVADELLRKIARQLFVKEKKLKKPFLLVVEEVHEYIPEGGGMGETGRLLIKISKRGRKHGLGILGISQRPADVKKDFITQANWLVWHRLTWDNDTNVVGRIIDTEYSELVSELNDGQGFVQTDWMDVDVRKVQFRRKRTFDAGATPGLDDFERPELKSVSDALVGDLQDISERKDREESRILELENELEKKEKRIETLEDELESARDVSNAAKQMADALTRKETLQTKLGGGDDEELRRLHDEIVDLETEREDLEDERDELQAKLDERTNRIETLEGKLASRTETVDRLREENERLRDRVRDLETEAKTEEEESNATSAEETEILQAGGDDVEFGFTSVEWPSQTESDADESEEITTAPEPKPPEAVFEGEWIDDRLERAAEQSQCTASTARRALVVLARNGPLESAAIADAVGRSTVAVQGLCSELLTEGVLERPVARTYTLSDDVRSKLDAMASAE
ncbi:helicase HerA domain-containing protein [Natronorubrum sp. DTA28]|uniref:ATP-binding protein n=1 Tax=Natronorubrum sp. DTA28 TaxID=3447019 RepID=UPI003F82CF5F